MADCVRCGVSIDDSPHRCAQCGTLVAVPAELIERTEHFVGRSDDVIDVADWLAAKSAPFRLVVGEPGVGKSAFMAWLTGVGDDPIEPEGAAARSRIRDAIAAAHFCVAKKSRAAQSLDPATFARSLIRQLSASVPNYGQALAHLADPNITVSVDQEIGQIRGGSVVGVRIDNLNVADAASLYGSVFAPFAHIDGEVGRSLILVDALDEAELWQGPTPIGELLAGVDDLPPGFQILASSRPRNEVTARFERDWIAPLDPSVGDVRTYVFLRADREGSTIAPEVLERLVEQSGGNFLYARTALDFWLPKANEIRSPDDIPNAPSLNELYATSLQREYGDSAGRQRWEDDVRPLLGALGTGREPFADSRLGFVLAKPASKVRDTVLRCEPYLTGDLPTGPFGLYHQSFAEFLFDPGADPTFAIDEAEAHATTATRYTAEYAGRWNDCHDDYGLQFSIAHLAEAAALSGQPAKHAYTEQLVETITDSSFAEARRERTRDVVAYLHDMVRSFEEACADTRSDGLQLIGHAARHLRRIRREWLSPDLVFEAARAGQLEDAEERMPVFSPEPHWAKAVLLIAAWLAREDDPDGARALADRLIAEAGELETLSLLAERVETALGGDPPDEIDYPMFGEPSAEIAHAILDRMRGLGESFEVIAELLNSVEQLPVTDELSGYVRVRAGVSQIAEGVVPTLGTDPEQVAMMGNTTYLGGVDGPHLVAFAAAEPSAGDPLVAEYIELLAANGYVTYRNRSLWALLHHVVHHPRQSWVRRHALEICKAALAGTTVEFDEATPIARIAISERTGHATDPDLAAFTDQARMWASAIQNQRGSGDSWGYHKRRLGAIAEAAALADIAAVDISGAIDLALSLPYGFAGFQSPSCLALAESILIADPFRLDDVGTALGQAFSSAHCVQDPPFCARTTSRFNAIARWWGWPDAVASIVDIEQTVEDFVAHPLSAEYAAVHRIGEDYEGRIEPEIHLPFPEGARDAKTLAALAALYERPVHDFLRLNPNVRSIDAEVRHEDVELPEGTLVSVPDPGFVPHLASLFSAHVVAEPSIGVDRKGELLRKLLRVTANSTTYIDRILARLVLTVGKDEVEIVDALDDSLPDRPDPLTAIGVDGGLGPIGYETGARQ